MKTILIGVMMMACGVAMGGGLWSPINFSTNQTGVEVMGVLSNNFLALDNVVDDSNPADLKLDGAQLVAGSVNGAALTSNTVGSTALSDGGIAAADIANGAVTEGKIASDAVTAGKIADDAVGSQHYVSGSVDTTAISNGAITAVKIATGVVSTGKLDSAAYSWIVARGVVNETLVSNVLMVGDATFDYGAAVKGTILYGSYGALAGEIVGNGSGALAGGYVAGGGRIVASRGGMAHGYALNGGLITAAVDAVSYGYCDGGTIEANYSGAQANGYVFPGGKIKADNYGALAAGHVSPGGGSLVASQVGAIAMGASSGGNLIGSGGGSTANGYAKNGDITASGIGSSAKGYVNNGGMASSGYGSSANGYALNGTILASGISAFSGGTVENNSETNLASGKASFAYGRKVSATHDYSSVLGNGLASTQTNSVRVNTLVANNGLVYAAPAGGSNIVNKMYVDGFFSSVTTAAFTLVADVQVATNSLGVYSLQKKTVGLTFTNGVLMAIGSPSAWTDSGDTW